MISYRFVPISSQKGVLFLRHPVNYDRKHMTIAFAFREPAMI